VSANLVAMNGLLMEVPMMKRWGTYRLDGDEPE
jgi:hypothetical protein